MSVPESLKHFFSSRQGKVAAAVAVCLLLLLLVIPVAIGFMVKSRLKAATEAVNGKLKSYPIRFELASFQRGTSRCLPDFRASCRSR